MKHRGYCLVDKFYKNTYAEILHIKKVLCKTSINPFAFASSLFVELIREQIPPPA